MIPLYEVEQSELAKGNRALTFSVHKYNSDIQGRTITVAEAARCVVWQSKWAASHELVTLPSTKKIDVAVTVLSEVHVDGLGLLIEVEIGEIDTTPCRHQFIVSESGSHWFFFDYSLARISKTIEV